MKILSDHVKQVPDMKHVTTEPKPKIIRQEIRKEKPAYADPNYRPLTKPTESSMHMYPRETDGLDID